VAKHSSLFVRSVREEVKHFNIDTCGPYYKHITTVNETSRVVGE